MASLVIQDLHASIGDKPIVKGLSLTINSGEVHRSAEHTSALQSH